MQIVFLVHDIHFGGGGERVTINLANTFKEKGADVKIVSLSAASLKNIYPTNNEIGIDYLCIDFANGCNLINKVKSIFRVNSYFNTYKRNTIILGIGNYPSLLLSFLPIRKNIKTVGCQHLAYDGIKNLWALLRKLLFHRLNFIVCLTKSDLPKYKKLNKNSIVIPNSIGNFSEQTASLTNKQILFIGRVVPEKGYDILLKVVERVSKIHDDWTFRIIGEGPLRKKILHEFDLYGLTSKISWISSSDLIVKEYINSSIYLMTSRTEGLPMVLLEAQACGLPIISFNCETGPSDIINDGIDGYLIDNYNIDEMSKKLSMLCSNFNKRKEFGQNARKNVLKFFPDQVFIKWEALFIQLQT
ncbi:MAG: glycosyltransferase family 4 protein [Mariniphaga sp.]